LLDACSGPTKGLPICRTTGSAWAGVESDIIATMAAVQTKDPVAWMIWIPPDLATRFRPNSLPAPTDRRRGK
jgi:hypothetical protein